MCLSSKFWIHLGIDRMQKISNKKNDDVKTFSSHIKHVYMNLMFEYVRWFGIAIILVPWHTRVSLLMCLCVCLFFSCYLFRDLNIQHILNIKHRIKSVRYLLFSCCCQPCTIFQDTFAHSKPMISSNIASATMEIQFKSHSTNFPIFTPNFFQHFYSICKIRKFLYMYI